MRTFLVIAALVLLPFATVDAKDSQPNFAQDVLSQVQLGPSLQGDVAIVISLVLPGKYQAPPVQSQFGSDLSFAEPEFPSSRYAVHATNESDKPVLVLGGTVLTGGGRDRMTRYDTIVGPGETAELQALPAASTSEIRTEPTPFRMTESLGPVYLRRRADFGGNNGVITSFIARNLEFRNDDDKEKSLAAIGRSKVLDKYTLSVRTKCASCLDTATEHGSVVGAITAIHGRLQSVILYGSHSLLHHNQDAYLRGTTYAAAALALQAKKKNIPMRDDDPAATLALVQKEAAQLLERLRKARFKPDRSLPEGAVGERLLLQAAGGTRGRAVGMDGKLVSLTVYPHDPFSSALYGSRIEVPDETISSDPDRVGVAELGRRGGTAGRRLSERERRLLDRLGGAARPGIGGARSGLSGGGGRR